MLQNLSSFLYADEAACVDALAAELPWDKTRAARVQTQARELVNRVRSAKRKPGELESFLSQYGLDTEEGLALMTLAEALLRIPDARTADALIRDKITVVEWFGKQNKSQDILLKAAGIGLSLTRKTLDSAIAKLGEPVIRKAMVEAMRLMARRFVIGRTIEEAIKNARPYEKKGYRMSYDMLGEGARTRQDAQRYFKAYVDAAQAIGAAAKDMPDVPSPGISIKLSALYPRYEFRHAEECIPALTAQLLELAQIAANNNIALTVDAEEVDRLNISLKIIEGVFGHKSLGGWEGFGLAVQAYQKRTRPLIDHLADLAKDRARRLQIRLVKGAYWDAEIKRAQILGLPEYPLFTRKVNTDLSYLSCAAKLLDRRDIVYPMLATHNAHTIAAVIELAGNNRNGFEFQCLHAMAETLHDTVLEENLAPTGIYAPCGSHEDLLPYLVRRLLENGANSSFLNKMIDPAARVEDIVADPVEDARTFKSRRHPKIALPQNIYAPGRKNSEGVDLTEPAIVNSLLAAIRKAGEKQYDALPLVAGKKIKTGTPRTMTSPADNKEKIGQVWNADKETVEKAFTAARDGFAVWSATPADKRAATLERAADLMEEHRAELMALCVREGGKTIDDALAEVREAVDFCRYYAMTGRADFAPEGRLLPGPTGEKNALILNGRGVFVCVSPWNFPLAIFTGQVAAALMAGNAVIAKPASLTPLIAMRAVELMHEAGVPGETVQLLPAGGALGGVMVAHPDTAGVAFTGSTDVGWQINRALAARNGPIAPLIAETGGQTAMIVDSSALPEQVIDDVIVSAFTSAGQRCSALRVLYLQEEIADKMVLMLRGAMAERKVGDPALLSSDIGPVIDGSAREELEKHIEWLDKNGRFIAAMNVDENLAARGSFFAPAAYEINSIRQLSREVFGPVLHVIRFKSENLDDVIADINSTGYGLTLGVHSRISTTVRRITEGVRAGNAYVNRTMIGAVVGVQPFGGQGLSGTGPKAGGPHYLHRFATEKVVSTDTTRQGGNASLVSLRE